MNEQPQRRHRDADATRTALLEAATELFAERGFGRTTVRDIAARAGVNQALLFRYFGTKDALFATILARQNRDRLVETPREQLFARTLRDVLATGGSGERDHSLAILLRAGDHAGAARVIQQDLGREYSDALAVATDAGDAALRGDLVLAWLIGIAVLRSIAGKEPLVNADVDQVVEHVLGAVRVLLERVEDVSPT